MNPCLHWFLHLEKVHFVKQGTEAERDKGIFPTAGSPVWQSQVLLFPNFPSLYYPAWPHSKLLPLLTCNFLGWGKELKLVCVYPLDIN